MRLGCSESFTLDDSILRQVDSGQVDAADKCGHGEIGKRKSEDQACWIVDVACVLCPSRRPTLDRGKSSR